ncbi:inorganic triphosphatase [Pseudaminobacter soli (ex Li et al. 2025)]|uniref:Inorganic triphosphatase n=1 Tax=Pseudaminobacter soli (ex Li et al. 2025) TaxID=1295366 RepID=A0A2P7RMD1_9HYPH|nr:inorganic triphosphatase [Mesorhizobium soli]PSJ51377.1 inorganic triphosphatase [Mesorhizobium soli]
MPERELKFELSPTGAASLLERNPFDFSPMILQQKSIYFDTPKWDLFNRGMSFRIRQSGNERIQTLKAGNGSAAGLLARGEWEQPVPGDAPVLDNPQVHTLLAGCSQDLAPLFEVHVKRHRWTVTEGDATVEVVLDIGKVVAADREAPLCEFEFESKAGPLGALFQLARRVDRITPGHLGVLSKAERGYRLLGPAPGAIKASTIPLTHDMTAALAFAQIAAACLRQFRLNEIALGWSRDAAVLHQARVSLRRLRALLSIGKSLFEDSRFDHIRDELRWLARETGDARDIDVMIERARGEELSDRLQGARNDAYAEVEAALSSSRARALMIDAAEWISGSDWQRDQSGKATLEAPAKEFSSAVFDKFWKKVAKKGRNLTDVDDETRHKLRIAAKKLRYAAEFFGPLYDSKKEAKRHRRFIAAMEHLQDQLGGLNDLVTASTTLSALKLSDVAGAEGLSRAADKKKLLHEAAEAHEHFVDAKRFWR